MKVLLFNIDGTASGLVPDSFMALGVWWTAADAVAWGCPIGMELAWAWREDPMDEVAA